MVFSKVECVYPMIISSEFRMKQYGDDDLREDAPYFKIWKWAIPDNISVKSSDVIVSVIPNRSHSKFRISVSVFIGLFCDWESKFINWELIVRCGICGQFTVRRTCQDSYPMQDESDRSNGQEMKLPRWSKITGGKFAITLNKIRVMNFSEF